jgi:hypothetical protein
MVSVRPFRYPIWVGLDRSSVTNPSLKTPASTALLVELGPTAITLTSCGHPPAILVTSRGAATYLDVPAGLPLGLGDDFQQAAIAWGSGDRLLLYTDGLSEARDRHGEFLPLLDIVPQLAAGTPEEALDTLLDELRGHVPRAHLGDDLAVLLLERKRDAAPAINPETHMESTHSQPLAPGTSELGVFRLAATTSPRRP